MDDARARAEAASTLARARWGTTKLDGMIAELHDRADELGTAQIIELQAIVAEKDLTAMEES